MAKRLKQATLTFALGLRRNSDDEGGCFDVQLMMGEWIAAHKWIGLDKQNKLKNYHRFVGCDVHADFGIRRSYACEYEIQCQPCLRLRNCLVNISFSYFF